MNVHSSCGARLARKLPGPANLLAKTILLEELRQGDWRCKDDLDSDGTLAGTGYWDSPDLMQGINRLMDVLSTIGAEAPSRKGQVMRCFCQVLQRRRDEEMTPWVLRLRDVRIQLGEEDCSLSAEVSDW